MQIYGLTGGIASGKSEAARRFVERGIPVIDADQVAHTLLAPGGAAVEAVIEAFGPAILTDGAIDREKLGAVVFGDPAARRRINAIVHPIVTRLVVDRCAALAQKGHAAAIVEAALLAENGQREPWLDGLIVVACSAEQRRQRLVATRAMSPGEVQRRMDAQTPPEHKTPLADWVIENEGPLETLYAHVDRLAHEFAPKNA